MRSIKPGRDPSMMGGVVGIVMICIGILWTVVAGRAAGFMVVFGLLWTCIAVVMTVYNFRNATRKNRYSVFDITEEGEEPDPLQARFGGERPMSPQPAREDGYCPYCGAPVQSGFAFCRRYGRQLP